MSVTNDTKLKKGDQVVVLSGKDKGKTGKIVKIDLENSRVTVESLNMVSKAVKKRSQQDQGGIIQIEGTMHISNVSLINSKGKPTRVGYKIDGKNKTRVAAGTGEKL